jgi:beta-N-acetylhexosaminidase
MGGEVARSLLVPAALVIALVAGCNTAAPPSAPSALPSPSASPSPSPSEPPPCSTAIKLAGWTLDGLAQQTITVPVEETRVSAVSAQVAAGAGGVILFGSDAPTTLGTSLATLTAKAPDGLVPFVMTDEEGGSVQRMANLVGKLPSAREMAKRMTPKEIHDLALAVGKRLRSEEGVGGWAGIREGVGGRRGRTGRETLSGLGLLDGQQR